MAFTPELRHCGKSTRTSTVMNGHALVVASGSLGADIVEWLSSIGHRARLVSDFLCAKHEVDTNPPQLLITQLKLGAFNGLHLVARARGRGLMSPAIVIGEADRVLADEARHLDARYVVAPLDEDTFLDMALSLLHPSTSGASL
jgi:DNA-binding response OmpR family regulator